MDTRRSEATATAATLIDAGVPAAGDLPPIGVTLGGEPVRFPDLLWASPGIGNLAQPVTVPYQRWSGKTSAAHLAPRLNPPAWVPSRRVRRKMVRLAGRDSLSPLAIQAHYRDRNRFYDINLIRSILCQRGLA